MAIKPKNEKISPRARRRIRIRKRLAGGATRPRVSVFRSNANIYAQVITDTEGRVLATASTRDKDVQNRLASLDMEGLHSESKSLKSVAAAKAVGLVLAERCKEKSLETVVFDRNGYLYHGRVKAIADGLREGGLVV